MAEDLAACGDQFTRRLRKFPTLFFEIRGEELLVVAARDKADLL